MVELMARYGTAVESWGPLAEGLNGIFSHPFSRTMLNAEGQHHGTGGVPLHVRLHVVPFREIFFPELPQPHVLLLVILDDADASEADDNKRVLTMF